MPRGRRARSAPTRTRAGSAICCSCPGSGHASQATTAYPGNVFDAEGHLLSYDIEAQCRQVFANVRAVLEASGARWQDLVDVTVFLTDMQRDFATYNRVYAEHFTDAQPCRTTLGISALPTPIAIELKCIAVMGDPS